MVPLLSGDGGNFIVDGNLADHMVALVGDIDVAVGIHGDAVDFIEEDFAVFEKTRFLGCACEEPELVGLVNGWLEDEEEVAQIVRVILGGARKNPAECGVRPSAGTEEASVEASGGESAETAG